VKNSKVIGMPKTKKSITKKLRKFSLETRLKSAQEFKKRLLEKFGDYIKAVIIWGSITRGDFTGKSDVDIYIIFDDTKASIRDFNKVRDKIDEDIMKIAKDVDPRIHPQPIIALTEFIDGVRLSHPLFFNIIREGYAIHDTGFFIPMRKLLEMGHFPLTKEAAIARMETVPKRIERVKNVKLYMIAEDIYYALLDSAQAVLMYLGVPPPPPKVAPKVVREHLVETGLLKEEYAKMLEDVIKFRKAVEHKEIKEISGSEVDKWIRKAEKYVKEMEKLFRTIELRRKAEDVKKMYEVMIKASVTVLKSLGKLPEDPKELPKAFKEELIDKGLVSPIYSEVFERVVGMRRLLEEKKLDKIPDRDVYMSKEYVRRFVNEVKRILSEKKEEEREDIEEKKTEKVGRKRKKTKEE
jgi:uncharacterized protein (UPF0332 family)/predicted nucleotidyltransferase